MPFGELAQQNFICQYSSSHPVIAGHRKGGTGIGNGTIAMEDPLLHYTRRGFAIQEVVLASLLKIKKTSSIPRHLCLSWCPLAMLVNQGSLEFPMTDWLFLGFCFLNFFSINIALHQVLRIGWIFCTI